MDKILIRGLEIEACHGVKDFEKREPQPFVFDADIYADFSRAYSSDDIADTVNYSSVCKIIGRIARENTFNLIEKLAYECAYAVMEELPAKKIALTLYKPKAPMKQKFGSVGVFAEVERERAYLSLGSSLGDRKAYLDMGIEKLNTFPHIKVKKVSSYIETEPYGGVAENRFLNCAVEVETLLTPRALLAAAQRIEAECGRTRERRWADRTLDIDIVFFGDKIIAGDGLIIPHPEYAKRDFVLSPLKEIAPNFVCPDLKIPLKRL